MKKRILLIDESLTVQKVVALTLDRERYAVTNAKTRSEAMKIVLEAPPDLILISDQVAGVSVGAFPKEVETWVGRDRRQPALVLISGQDVKDSRGFRAVLKKPFAPAALQTAVTDALNEGEATPTAVDEADDSRMQKIFSDTFSDEAKLVAETYNAEIENSVKTLLNIPAPHRSKKEGVQVLGPEDSMAYKAQLEKQVGHQLESYDLEDIVHRLLEKMVPPIVERMAADRLDQLLKESEGFVELKP